MKPEMDIDSLRTEHESDEQWEVRRSFMMEHKDKFSEAELVTLAQLFTNIEFLGCRYMATVMEDMAIMGQKILANMPKKHNNNWYKKYPKFELNSGFHWRSMDVRCVSHNDCEFDTHLIRNVSNNETASTLNTIPVKRADGILVKTPLVAKRSAKAFNSSSFYLKNTQNNKQQPKIGTARSLNIIPATKVDRQKTKIKTAVETETNAQSNLYLKIAKIDKLVLKQPKIKKEKKQVIKTSKPRCIVEQAPARSTGMDYNLLNIKNVNRNQYKVKMANENFKENAKDTIELKTRNEHHKPTYEPKETLHPLLVDFSYFVIFKEDKTLINIRPVNVLLKYIKELLDNIEVTSEICYYELTHNFTDLIFSINDLGVEKFVNNYEFNYNGAKYLVKTYELVKAALLIPTEQKYDTKNILPWLKYLNRHINFHPLSWEIFDEYVDDVKYIYLRIPKADAITLSRFHYNLNFIDIKLKLKLFPKSKKNLEFSKLQILKDSKIVKDDTEYLEEINKNIKKISIAENIRLPEYKGQSIKIRNKRTDTAVAGGSNSLLSDSLVDKTNEDENEVFEKAVLFMAEDNKFEINPLIILKSENLNKNLNMAKWKHLYLDDFYRENFVVSMPADDALKLKRKQVRIKFRSAKVRVRFPDDPQTS